MERPRGVPIQVAACVNSDGRDTRGSDITVSGRKVVVNPTAAFPDLSMQDFDLDDAYGVDSTESDLFERTLQPLVRAFLEGVCASVVVIGGADSGKTRMLEKLVPLTMENMFMQLQEKQKKAAGGRRGRGGSAMSFSAECSFYEIYDEIIQDLLNAENRDLEVVETEQKGICVKECTVRGPFTDPNEVLEHYAEGKDNRTNAMSDFGPASRHASAVFQLDLTQATEDPSGDPKKRQTVRSRFLFVDVAGTDKCVEDPTTLRMKEGPTLSKSVLNLRTVAETLSGSNPDAAPYKNGKLTHLLSDALGGNSISICLVALKADMSDVSLQTLKLAQHFQRTQNFPVVMDERTQGLVRRFRVRLSRLRDEIETARAGAGGDQDSSNAQDAQDLAMKYSELEGKYIRDNLEKLKMREDKERIYEKLMEFKDKYNKLVKSKAELQANLIKGEEERLRISKALLDLQIENNQLVERSESEKYELVTKLLNAENDILELEMKEQNKDKKSSDLQEQLEAIQREKKELAMEFVTLKTNFVNLNQDYKSEVSKNEELGVELLTLVNQKNALAAEKDELTRERDTLQQDTNDLTKTLGELNIEKRDTEEKLRGERELTEQLRSEKVTAELQLQRATVDFENRKLTMEKNTAEYTRERDSEVLALKKGAEGEQKRYDAAKEQLTAQIKQLEANLRRANRKTVELETSLGAKLQEEAKLTSDNDKLNARINSLTENYRAKLMEYINEEGGEGEEEQAQLREELIGTYRKKEVELQQNIEEYRNRNHDLVKKNRGMFDKYRELKYRLEDIDPTMRMGQDDVKELRVEGSDVEAKMERELIALREKVRHTGAELQAAQEKSVQNAEQYRRLLKDMEARNAEMATEIKLLEKQKQHLQEEMEQRAVSGGGMDPAAMKQLQDMQKSMMEQISEIKSSGGGGGGGGIGNTSDAEVSRLRQELADARASGGGGGGGGGGGDALELRRLKDENASLKEKIAKGPAAMPEFANAGEAEKRAAELMTRNAVVEEELKNYQKYMKTNMVRYQKEIAGLKKECSFWKKKAVEAGVPPNAYGG